MNLPSGPASIRPSIVVGASLVAFAAFASRFILLAATIPDEGFYLAASHCVARGMVPYRDFGFAQAPAYPYLMAGPMAAFHLGLIGLRFMTALFALAAVVAAVWMAHRRGSATNAFVIGIALSTSTNWVYFGCLCKNYAPAAAFLVGAAVFLLNARSRPGWLAASAALSAAAVLCRLSVAPAALLLGLTAVTSGAGLRARASILAAGLLVLLAVSVPLFVAAPNGFSFWNWGYHTASQLGRPRGAAVNELLRLSPSVVGLMVLALAFRASAWRNPFSISDAIFIAAVFGVLAQLAVPSPWGNYAVPFFPLAALGSALVLAEHARQSWSRYAVLALPLLNVISPSPPLDRVLVEDLAQAGALIASVVPPGAAVLTPLPEVALAGHREIVRGLEMGDFSLTNEMTEARARELHLSTLEDLENSVENRRAPAIVLSTNWKLNFAGSVPSMIGIAPAVRAKLLHALSANYRPALENSHYVVLVPLDSGLQ